MLRIGLGRLLAQQANVQLACVTPQAVVATTPLTAAAAAAAAANAVIQHSQQHCPQSAALLWQWPRQQQVHTSTQPASAWAQHTVQLDRLRPASGSTKLRKRWGRGDGGDRGSYCGYGVKGQKSRKGNKPHLLFDGGQNQMKKFPKVWLRPRSPVLYKELGLSKVLHWVRRGLLDASEVITMKDLRDSGCAPKTIRWGIELVATGQEQLRQPLHLQVSSCSPTALQLVEGAGGSIERVYYTRLGLKALLKPENFEKKGLMLPRPVRAWPPRENGRFDSVGLLPPPRQMQSSAQAASAS